MAAGSRIIFEFADASGDSIFFTYNYGDDDASTSAVKNAMNTIIANGDIFTHVPVAIKGAKAVITSEVNFDLS